MIININKEFHCIRCGGIHKRSEIHHIYMIKSPVVMTEQFEGRLEPLCELCYRILQNYLNNSHYFLCQRLDG